MQGFPQGVVGFPEAVEGDDEGEEQPKTHEKAALRIPPQGQGLAPEGLEVQGEVDAPQEHEDGHHHIDVNALVIADGGVLGGKAAGGQGAEGVAEGVQEIHTPQQQEDGFGHREGHINLPEDHGGVFEAGFELIHRRPRHLGLVELHAAHPQEGEDGQAQDDDAQTAQPVGQAAPEEDARGHDFHVLDNRGPGGGEARGGLEDAVHQVGQDPGEIKRQSPEDAGCHPPHGGDGHAFPVADGAFDRAAPKEQVEKKTQADGDGRGNQEWPGTAVTIIKGKPQGKEHAQADANYQRTQDMEHERPTDHVRLTVCS